MEAEPMGQQKEQEQPIPACIVVLPGLVTMCPGGLHFVKAVVTDQDGYLCQENVVLEFMSYNLIVADVYPSPSGMIIRAMEIGSTLITIKICGTCISTTIQVQVIENYILNVLEIFINDLIPKEEPVLC